MKMSLLCALALVPAALAGCTDTNHAVMEAREHPLHVTCYSGGVVVVDDYSVKEVEWGDVGIFYRSQTTRTMVKAGADCIVVDEPMPSGWKAILPGRPR